MRRALFGVMILLTGLAACKKDKKNPGNTDNGDGTTGPSKDGTTFDLVRDSVYLYMKETYLWYDALPSYADFKPRSYTAGDELTALKNELNALSQYKLNPANGNKPFEYYTPSPGRAKYSSISVAESKVKLSATQGDFGFAPLYNDLNDLRISYVQTNSPADKAGLKRGYKITAINGRTNLQYDGAAGPNVQFVINAYTNSSTITMTVQKPDASTATVTLNTANYTLNPVMTYKVIPLANNKVIGYVVFSKFIDLNSAMSPLNAAFDHFVANNVTDLVVDFRYNGGGYDNTMEYLTDLIAPASKNGSVMYKAYFNDILASGRSKFLVNQVRVNETTGKPYTLNQVNYTVDGNTRKFAKKGGLEVSRVFFLVTGNTASASEGVINNLRPVMDVKLIGTTTYGKPVGFFDLNINKYLMLTPQIEIKNQAGQGAYYTGMTPGSAEYPGVNDYDDPTKDFGDPTEGLLAYAIRFVNTGKFTTAAPQVQVQGSRSARSFSIADAREAALGVTDMSNSNLIITNRNK